MHGGQSLVKGNQVTMNLLFNSIHILVDLGGTNLPVLHNLFVTVNQKMEIGPQMLSSLAYSILSKFYIFVDMKTILSLQDMDISS